MNDLTCTIFKPSDNLEVVRNASRELPRTPGLLAHSAGLFEALLFGGDELFPGICWALLSDHHGTAAMLPLQAVVEADLPVSIRAFHSLNRFEMLYADAQLRGDVRPETVRRALMAANAFTGHRVDVLRFRDLKNSSSLLAIATDNISRNSSFRDASEGASVISTTAPYDQWLKERSRNLRSQIKQADQRLSQHGHVSFNTIPCNEVSPAFERFISLEGSGWKASSNALSIDGAECRLFKTALLHHAPTNEAFISELRVNDHLVSSQIGLLLGNTLFLIRIAYDENFRNSSPGTLHMARLIEWCCSHPGISKIDCIVRQPWHDRWHPDIETHSRFTSINTRTARGALLCAMKNAQALTQRLRKSAPA